MGSIVQPLQRLASSRFVGLFLAVAVVTTWLTIVFAWPVKFWESNNDYVYLSLAHAINFEASLRGSVYADTGLLNHPGVPFYFASWLGLRAAALWNHDHDTYQSVLSNPDHFFWATRI